MELFGPKTHGFGDDRKVVAADLERTPTKRRTPMVTITCKGKRSRGTMKMPTDEFDVHRLDIAN